MKVIKENHGVKEANLLALLLPIGISTDDLDPIFLATMNSFGEQRGRFAHSSAATYQTQQPPDPQNELSNITQILSYISDIDQLISAL